MESTRLLPDHEVAPLERPVQDRGVVGLTVVRKLVPDTVTVLMFVPVVAMVNDTVAVTLAAFLTLLDSTTEGAVSPAAKMAGKATKLTPSMLVLSAA